MKGETFADQVRARRARAAEADREASETPGIPGWRRVVAGGPHPKDLEEIVGAIRSVAEPRRILLFGSGARHEMKADSDIDILVISQAPNGVLELKLDICRALPMDLRPTDVVVLTPGGMEKRLVEWNDQVLQELIDEATVLYESPPAKSR